MELLLLPEAPKGPRELRDTAGLQKTVLALGAAGISPTLRHPQKDGVGLWAHVTKQYTNTEGPPAYYKSSKATLRCHRGAPQCLDQRIEVITLACVLQFINILLKMLLQKLNQWDLCSHKLYSYLYTVACM